VLFFAAREGPHVHTREELRHWRLEENRESERRRAQRRCCRRSRMRAPEGGSAELEKVYAKGSKGGAICLTVYCTRSCLRIEGGLGWLVAQCLEHNLTASSKNPRELHQKLESVLKVQIEADLEAGKPSFSTLPAAPRRFWTLFQSAEPWRPADSDAARPTVALMLHS
jgi:hypothetical protein